MIQIGGVVIALLALTALIGTAMTFAQDDTPDTTPAPEAEDTPTVPGNGMGMMMGMGHGRMPGMHGPRFFNSEAYDAALADELGITVEELNAARQAAKETVLQQLVADGTITQAQADAILSGEGLRSIGPLMLPEQMQAVVADALGITVAELEAARAEGKRLPELAAELGVALEDVQTAVQAAHEAAILQAVEDGLITQEQADWMRQQHNNGMGMGMGLGMPGGGPRGGHHGGPGGFGGGFGPRGGGQGNGNGTGPVAPQG
ncbi:MAG: hypothetical protein BroJett015_27680 [Chloroflexota bacterium]|nr:MAG: hypothetical protein BroJett015_27680 [Chloroflexota bacterium]